MGYYVLAYYRFVPIIDPVLEVARHKEFFDTRDIKGRIYLSHEGINGQISASVKAAEDYMEWLRQDPRFEQMEFRIHSHPEHCFPRATIKNRKQLVAIDADVDMRQVGVHLSPAEWKKKLEERDVDTLVIDVRNEYEWRIGHFEGAELPLLEQFREFPSYAEELKSKWDPKKTKVMMYCTGGIRCELYSSLLKAKGFEQVYQLGGGVIQYGMEVGTAHWKGKLFVFDDRLAIPISKNDNSEVISHCSHCKGPSDIYVNCANMDCNHLYLSCSLCAEKTQGCCSLPCMEADRVRHFVKSEHPKPYRRQSINERDLGGSASSENLPK